MKNIFNIINIILYINISNKYLNILIILLLYELNMNQYNKRKYSRCFLKIIYKYM